MVRRKSVAHVAQQLRQLFGEVVGCRRAAVALQRVRGHRIGARRTADRQVDTTRMERAQRLKISATFSGL